MYFWLPTLRSHDTVHTQWPHQVQRKSANSICAYFLTTDDIIIMKLDRNKQIKIYTNKLKFTQISKYGGQQGVFKVRWPTYTFLEPPISLEWVNKVKDFKFGVQIDCQPRNEKCKSRSEEAWPTSHDILFLIFCTPHYIYGTAEHTNLNLVHRLTTRGTI